MHCAYLKQADGGWTRTESVEDILNHEGAIVEVNEKKEEDQAVLEIRGTSPEELNVDGSGSLFTSEHRIEENFHGHWRNGQTHRLTPEDFDRNKTIVIKDRHSFVLVHLGGKQLITDCGGFEDIVGKKDDRGYVVCRRDPTLARACHDKRTNKRDKNRRKRKQENTVKDDLLKQATWELHRVSGVSPSLNKWTLPSLLAAMLVNDTINDRESTNKIVNDVAGLWLLRTEANELRYGGYSGEDKKVVASTAGKLTTKRFGFREAQEVEVF